jgi:hypothetical protein
MLLQTIIDDIKSEKIMIIKKQIKSKPYYNSKGRRYKPRISTYYYAVDEKGEKRRLNKKFLEEIKNIKNPLL